MNILKHFYSSILIGGLFSFQIIFAQSVVIDNTFGNNGIVVTDARNDLNDMVDMMILPNDKILIAGKLRVTGNRQFNIVKYNADGSIDSTYGSGGMSWSSFGNDAAMAAIAVEPDGKIVATGTKYGSSKTEILLVRYTETGSFDMSMNNFSSSTTELPALNSEVQAMTLQEDGKILVAGITETSSNQFDLFIARFTYFGIIDSTFGTNGFVFESLGGSASKIARVIGQSDGKILLGGNNSSNWLVHRYMSNGTPDNTFGTNGKFINSQSIVLEYGASDLHLLPDGKILQFGTSSSGNRTFGIQRYTSSGAIDNSFGINGDARISVGENVVLACAAVQLDGKIFAGGGTILPPMSFAFSSYDENGQLDTLINESGTNTRLVKISPDTSSSIIKKIGVQQDGKIIVAGNSGDNYALVRFQYEIGTSVNNFSPFENFQLYPNPATNNLFIDLGKIHPEIILEIHNINGQLIERKKLQNTQQHDLNISQWSEGLYFISVISENGVVNKEFVKQ